MAASRSSLQTYLHYISHKSNGNAMRMNIAKSLMVQA